MKADVVDQVLLRVIDSGPHLKWTLPQKPILLSEFGAEAKQGNHGGKDQRWAEEQQVNVYEHQFVMIKNMPQVRVLIPWILMDFRSPGRNIPKLQDGFNRKGLVSEDGKKKQASTFSRRRTRNARWGRRSRYGHISQQREEAKARNDNL